MKVPLKSISIDHTITAPEWAILEREIIDKLNAAAPEFVARYTRADGSLIWRDTWGSMDGSDDPYEAFMYLALLYSMGGSEEVYDLARKMWDAITIQWTSYGQIYREFDGYYDWMHHGEGYLYHYFFGLTKPDSLIDRQRAKRFSDMYTGLDTEAKNWDGEKKMILSPLTGSRGPRHVVTHEDWQTHRTVLDDYLAPYEDIVKTDFSSMRCHWSDPEVYEDLIKKMNLRMNRGDVPLNLNATSLMTHAFMYSHENRLKEWVLTYLGAWKERTATNGGIIPDNIGLSGVIGEYNDGKWWGGYYGWRWPHGFMTIMEPLTNAAMNAVLLTGDYSHLDLARSQFDLMWSLRKEEDGNIKTPNRRFDSGWGDYRTPSPRHMIYLWTSSMAEEDLARIAQLPRDNDWNVIAIPGVSGRDSLTGRDTKHYIANTLPWFQFIQGKLPNYPVEILKANIELINTQLRKMRSKTGDPRSWDTYDPATADEVVGLDLRIDGYQIHAWQEFSPIYFEGLAQMTMGAPMHISHGGLQHGKVRFFDGDVKRPGLPADVGVVVDTLTASSIGMKIANINTSSARTLVIQAGAFGEHRFISVEVRLDSGVSTRYEIGSQWFQVELAAQAGATLLFEVERYVNSPSYETPFSALDDWDPLINSRPSENFNR
ncbi:MAG: hypothetical protein F2954_01575 [Actinobacteria bacterium]|uniref:Unannotated protein n=1 Tax=freshwater metagenome TaxID=449393 RepID=A0A6J7VR05_9ZZZZ|nr:hypothetical protein [Actinomycetota bacterium]